VDSATSPRSPLDCNMLQSPRSPKHFDQQGGIGLGIVVALNNNNNTNKSRGEILAKYTLYGQISRRSNPIPMNNNSRNNYNYECETKDNSIEEEFTYVTSHGPKKTVTTRVYCDGVEYGHLMERTKCTINRKTGVFKISSPARLYDDRRDSNSDFLSSCNLCRKTLHGKDIYMYRGEKAFCSEECRHRQIVNDERKEKMRSKASRSSNVSSSPYSYTTTRGSQIFSPGIVAV